MERQLATIQKIESLTPIENSDHLAVARVLGWNVVVRKDEWKDNNICVYVEVDSILPPKPEFEFMKPRNYRVKTIRLRGQVSQGLCLPISILPQDKDCKVGEDVSEVIGITKYEIPIPAILRGKVKGAFPGFLPKTDEIRVQTIIDLLEFHKNKAYYATEKLDGTSFTAFKYRDDFGICSRNLQLQLDDGTVYTKIAKELDLQSKIPEGFAIQGEIVGPGIQNNKLKLNKHELRIYNLFNVLEQKYMAGVEMMHLIDDLGLDRVPYLFFWSSLPSLEEMIRLAVRKSLLNISVWAEGIVVRAVNEEIVPRLGRLSFKVINPEFLLEYGE